MSEKGLQILQEIECSSMVSTWKEYLCLETRDGRAVLSHRRFDVLGEVSEFAVETEEGDEEYRIPEVIDGKLVAGIEDGYIVGGELTADACDPEPEIELSGADRETVHDWLTERGFDKGAIPAEVWAGTSLDGSEPNAAGDQAHEKRDDETDPDETTESVKAQIPPVAHLRIRLRRWMDVPATAENDYPAEVVKKGDSFHYTARGVTVPITEDEALQVIDNPFLYYFSTALKLHNRIDAMRKAEATVQVRTLIAECCPDWEILETRTREGWFAALKKEFGVSGYQKEGMEEPVEFDIDELEFVEEHPTVDVLDESALAGWVRSVHDEAVELGPLVQQLRDLATRATELQLVPTVTTAGLRYCGTIESSRVRVVTKRGEVVAAFDLRPADCTWDECVERTFGPMWESPDDLD